MSSAVTGTRDRSVLPGNPDAVSWNARTYLLWMFAILALRKRERIAALPVQEFLRRCRAPSPSRCASPGSTHHRTARSPGSFDHAGRRYGHHRLHPHGREQRWPTHHGTNVVTFELECSEEFALSYRTRDGGDGPGRADGPVQQGGRRQLDEQRQLGDHAAPQHMAWRLHGQSRPCQ